MDSSMEHGVMMREHRPKTIYILLTAYTDFLAIVMRIMTFGRYTHASIGTEDQRGIFFSFVTKGGFHTERPLNSRRAKKRKRKCALYRLETSEEIYQAVKENLANFSMEANNYRYSFFGVALCLIRIPYRNRNTYFCSQFVSELLMLSGALKLRKQPCLYLPDDFRRQSELQLCFQGTLGELSETNYY
ncbi:MAG: hypothetical protein FWG30_03815 [Eubacteriaceae bacterium]|nr:hypothetical protein [Eubacteriaceae bacterium]